MLKSKIRTFAVTGTILGATLLALSATGAFAATNTAAAPSHSAAAKTAAAPGHVTAPRSAETPTGCVAVQFGIWDENTYETCVRDEQILLNDLWYSGSRGPNQLLKVDGYYGNDTFSDVEGFQAFFRSQGWDLTVDGITGPHTWEALCVIARGSGFTGTYWHDAGCATEP